MRKVKYDTSIQKEGMNQYFRREISHSQSKKSATNYFFRRFPGFPLCLTSPIPALKLVFPKNHQSFRPIVRENVVKMKTNRLMLDSKCLG